MRARITLGIARRVAKLVNPTMDAEARQLARQRETNAAMRDQKVRYALIETALRNGMDSLTPEGRAKLTLADRWIIRMNAGLQRTPEKRVDWERRAVESQRKLIEDARK